MRSLYRPETPNGAPATIFLSITGFLILLYVITTIAYFALRHPHVCTYYNHPKAVDDRLRVIRFHSAIHIRNAVIKSFTLLMPMYPL